MLSTTNMPMLQTDKKAVEMALQICVDKKLNKMVIWKSNN